ncbi:MAG: hypothetical protein WBE26_12245 [Phycisphaerae bacterium]
MLAKLRVALFPAFRIFDEVKFVRPSVQAPEVESLPILEAGDNRKKGVVDNGGGP